MSLPPMYRPISAYLGLRYARSNKGGGFMSFISASSTVGIGLGVMVLIIVLSAMNGFEKALAQHLLSVVPHAELESVNEPMQDWQVEADKINAHPRVIAVAPVVKLQGMLQKGKALKGVEIRGVDPILETKVSAIKQFITHGKWSDIANKNAIILGQSAANKLGLKVGDSVQVLLPGKSQASLSKKFVAPTQKTFTLVALYKFSGELDANQAYISLSLANDIKGLKNGSAEAIRLNINDVFSAPTIARDAAFSINHVVYILNWTHTQSHIYNDIQLVRLVMYIVLVLVIAVASFNIVSTLFMAVNEKQSDIAILKTMGANSSTIVATFMLQGIVNGVIGCLSGGVLGVLIAQNLTALFTKVESIFDIKLLKSNIYFVDYLPSELVISDVVFTILIALSLSILATIYPAIRATKIEPAQVLGQS